MSEPQDSVYFPVLEAIERHTGVKVDRVTVWRWFSGKLKSGRRLETWQVGRTRVSTLEAVEDFLSGAPELIEVDQPAKEPSRSKRQREKEKALREINELF